MRTPRFLAALVVAIALVPALLPAFAGAQQPIDPPILPPDRCFDCWWPVTPIATLDRFEADLDVTDGLLVARYRLALSNPGEGLAEGRIVVPVPAGSSVTDLVLSGGPETLEGRVLDADEAQRLYDDIVRRLIDPALLRSLGDDLYEVRAFPVPAGEQRSVSFTVTSPLVATDDQVLVEIPWARMSPRPAAASVSLDIDVPWEVRSVFAPGLNLDVDRKSAGELSASWESGSGWTAATSLRIYIAGGEGLIDTRVLTYREAGEDGFFALLFAPVLSVDASVARDIVLVLDTSGSMEGDKIEQAHDAASYVLSRLGDDDRFAVVSFSRTVRVFGKGLERADRADAAIDYVDGLDAGGGTNIADSLTTAFDLLSGDRPATVIFVTDGLPTVGVENTDAILEIAARSAPERAQLFAFGVGYDVDTVLLDALATRFVGTSHYVTPEERIDAEVGRLYERVSTPVLTDVEIEIHGGDVDALAPATLTGLFAGQQALLTGRYADPGPMTVVVRGNSFDGPEVFEYSVQLPARDTADPAVAQLWAQRRVADLLTEIRIEGPRDSLIDQIVALATRFGIVTPYTSYLAEEPALALSDSGAANTWVERAAAAPSSGADAVAGAADLEELRAGTFTSGNNGGSSVRQLGAHSYYLVDGVWTRDGYLAATDISPIVVGSAAFASLVEAAPELAEAAALGSRVITLAADGTWIELNWPDADGVQPVAFELPRPKGTADPTTATLVVDPPAQGLGTTATDEQHTVAGLDGDGRSQWLTIVVGLAALALGGAFAAKIARR
ncbi:MAG: VWA domain-containing protein [Chloroflexi bacterium]|nr:VWA domain-containing protein [Chloroflexota bacterium]MDA1147354.1 VWA domain-containing protein [Chloroflexota bacterium]